MKNYTSLLLLAVVLGVALADDKAPTRFLQQQKCSTTSAGEAYFSGLLIVDIEGKPGLWTDIVTTTLELAVQVAYGGGYSSCNEVGDADGATNGFYENLNVTVEPPTFFGGSTGSGLLRNFSLPVFLEGRTNLTAFVDAPDGTLFFAADEPENATTATDDGTQHRGVGRRTRVLPDCSCPPLPNKSNFVDLISKRMAHNTEIVERILNVHETVAVDYCQDTNVTEFESGIAIQVIGDVDIAEDSTECFPAVAEAVASVYNMLNVLNEETCDPFFREISDATAYLDANSIRSLLDDDDDDGLERRRKLVQTDSFSPTSLASPPPAEVPTGTTTLFPSTPLPSLRPSTLSPSSSPPPSESPSSTMTISPTNTPPTNGPTYLPTTHGADLNAFTLLIRLSGHCRGCSREQHLFDDERVAAAAARMERRTRSTTATTTSGNLLRTKKPSTSSFFVDLRSLGEHDQLRGDDDDDDKDNTHGRELLHLTSSDRCYCSAEAEEGAPTESEFLDALQMEFSLYGGSGGEDNNNINNINNINNNNKMGCIDSVTAVEEIRIFDCAVDQGGVTTTELVTYLDVEFSGHLDTLTDEEVMTLEDTALDVFQALEEMVCDPYQRSISSVRTVARGLVFDSSPPPSAMPSESPSTSFQPSSTISPETRRNLQDDGTTSHPSSSPSPSHSPSHQPSLRQTSDPTFQPTLDPSTNQPTFHPTSEPILFFLTFELTGECQGCQSDKGLFHQVPRRRKLRLSGDLPTKHSPPVPWRQSGTRKLVGLEGKCGCGLEAPDGGVTENEFASNFAEQVGNLDLPNVDLVNGVESTLVPPNSTLLPTTSPSPSNTLIPPTTAPSQGPSMPSLKNDLSTPSPNTLAPSPTTVDPTSQPLTPAPTPTPSLDSSTSPTSAPTSAPSPAPSPSPTSAPTSTPSMVPTQTPTPAPTLVPSPVPSPVPSVVPSGMPSPGPTRFPTKMPSPLPTQFPTKSPTAAPTQAPTASPTVGILGDGPCFAMNRGDSSATNGAVEVKFETTYAIIDFTDTGVQDLSQYILENFGGFNFVSLDNGYFVTVQRTWASLTNPGFMVLRSPHNEGDPELATFSDPVCTALNSLPP